MTNPFSRLLKLFVSKVMLVCIFLALLVQVNGFNVVAGNAPKIPVPAGLKIKSVKLEGELIANNVHHVRCNLQDNIRKTEYYWDIAATPTGEWEKIQGVRTDRIVLLTAYVNKIAVLENHCKYALLRV